tara:strand:+ start:30526 stop:30723 length:198 start_codon:yes stop_codon:yes gene_type:complete
MVKGRFEDRTIKKYFSTIFPFLNQPRKMHANKIFLIFKMENKNPVTYTITGFFNAPPLGLEPRTL